MAAFVHSTANVSEGVAIGDGTKVWINAQIREGVRIGSNCVIGKDTYIDRNVSVGKGVKIQNGVSVYQGVTLEDDVFVGPNAVFTNDMLPRAFSTDWEIRETLVRKGASIGANATIVCGHTIGEYAMIGAGSVVVRDVEDYALVVGNPARQIGHVCKCGKRLDVGATCSACGSTLDQKGAV